MAEIKKLLLNRVRIALLLSVAVVNVGMLWVDRAEAAVSCEKCDWKPGGHMGHYADCFPSGNISLCRAGGWNFCTGYTCGGGGDEEEQEFEPEGEFPILN